MNNNLHYDSISSKPEKSQIYTLDGNFEYTEDLYNCFPYFQKNIDILDKHHKIELRIAQKLILSPQDNLVRVYDIDYSDPIHIKYELLDMNANWQPSQELVKQLSNGIQNLHKMNCIYIDLKEDNIGYSLIDNSWKIFDFDCSGICTADFQYWLVRPPDLFMFQKINSIVSNLNSFLLKNKIELETEKKDKLEAIIKRQDLGKYDEIACFLSFNKFL